MNSKHDSMKNKIALEKSSMYEVEIVYKRPVFSEMPKITCSQSANELIHESVGHRSIDYKEYFWCFYLTNANMVLCYSEINCGTASGTIVNTCEIFATALRKSAAALVLVHNHPSGKLKPSTSDRELTNKIKVFGDMIGIKLLDHLIITSEKNYYSFADEGQLEDNKIPF